MLKIETNTPNNRNLIKEPWEKPRNNIEEATPTEINITGTRI